MASKRSPEDDKDSDLDDRMMERTKQALGPRSASTYALAKDMLVSREGDGDRDGVEDDGKRKNRWDSSESEDEGKSKSKKKAARGGRGSGDSPLSPPVSRGTAADSALADEGLVLSDVGGREGCDGGCVTCGTREQLEEDRDNPGVYYCISCWEAHDAAVAAVGSSGDEDSRAEGTLAGTGGAVEQHHHNPLFLGCRGVDQFEKLKMVDEGTYGMVFLARDRKTKELVALKKVKMSQDASNRDGFPITALRETNVLLALRHPNIVAVQEMVVGRRMDEVFMVMEYYEHDLKVVLGLQRTRLRRQRLQMLGSVNEAELKREPVFSIREVKNLMVQLLRAMAYMHGCWFLHRDLKTANILYNSRGKLAVCDFGLARKYGSPIRPYTTNVVTLYYRSPELLMGAKTYSTAVDMWSVGCIFAELLTGHYFFEGTSEVDQMQKILSVLGLPTAEKWPGYEELPHAKVFKWKGLVERSRLRERFPAPASSSAFTDANDARHLGETGFALLEGLLSLDPARRLSAKEALDHPWFAEEPSPLPLDRMPVYATGA